MLKNYFKTFWKVATQSKLFTFLSLFGISLTIMFVMIFSMTMDKILSGTGPESDLKEILFAHRMKKVSIGKDGKENSQSYSYLSRTLAEEHLKNIRSAEKTSMYTTNSWEFVHEGKHFSKACKQTDGGFWDIFHFEFIEGRPYNDEDVMNQANYAVITEEMREILFEHGESALGKPVRFATINLVVVGVIKNPPISVQNCGADLYFPYTLVPASYSDPYVGSFIMAFKAKSRKDFPAITDEIQDILRKLDAVDDKDRIFMTGPNTQLVKILIGYRDPEQFKGKWNGILKFLLYGLAFILLPAVNLMALNFARIRERGEEIAVRKSFGATSRTLRSQFIFENITLTLLGGFIGVVLSWLVVALFGDDLSIPMGVLRNVKLTFSFDPVVFLIAILSCLIFGLFSGVLPAFRMSRMKPVVYLKGGEI